MRSKEYFAYINYGELSEFEREWFSFPSVNSNGDININVKLDMEGNNLDHVGGGVSLTERIFRPKYRDVVRGLLESSPELRDDDRKLYVAVVKVLVPDYDSCHSGDELLYHISTKAPSWETVARIRRLLQSRYEHLRGRRYYERHGIAGDVRANINDIEL